MTTERFVETLGAVLLAIAVRWAFAPSTATGGTPTQTSATEPNTFVTSGY